MSSKAPKQKITATEVAATEVKDKQWQEYLDMKPLQDKAISMMTKDRLNTNGSVKINTSDSQIATEKIATSAGIKQLASGNLDGAIDANVELATGEAADSASKAFADQSDYLTGVDNVVAMGQGQEQQATLGQLEQARRAEQLAGNRIVRKEQTSAANFQAAGQLAGLGLGAFASKKAPVMGPKPGHTEY